MEARLTLKEKYLLLCYHPEKGNLLSSANFSSYGIAGAIMLELAEMNTYKLTNDRVVLSDTRSTGDEALDMVVERIARAKRPRKVTQWISNIVQSGLMRKVKSSIRDRLIEKKILSKREKTALIIFKYYRFPSRNSNPRRQLIRDLHNLVIGRKIAPKDILILTALIGATKMTNSFFLRDERRTARKRVKEIMKSNEIAKALDSTISAVQAAVITTITTSAVVSAAATSSSS